METEAPALWRKPPETATPSTLDKRASPRLYLTSSGARRGHFADGTLRNKDFGVTGTLDEAW